MPRILSDFYKKRKGYKKEGAPQSNGLIQGTPSYFAEGNKTYSFMKP